MRPHRRPSIPPTEPTMLPLIMFLLCCATLAFMVAGALGYR